MAAATKMKHPGLIALLHMLTFLDRDIARANLIHADADEGHEADGGVVGFDEDDCAGGEGGEVALAYGER